MKHSISKIIFTSILTANMSLYAGQAFAADSLADQLEKKTVTSKIREELAAIDINASLSLGDLDLIDGVNLSAKLRYEVESSYLDQYYMRVDKWDLKANINVGDVIRNFTDLPFSFSVNRQNSFLFVRQFKSKKEAVMSLPYTPKKLPLSADLALKNLNVGDFVSMPANLSIAVDARATTSYVAPVGINANAGVYYIISGEFAIQVFKLDESRVRLKLITSRASQTGLSGGVGLAFDVFGVRVLDKQLDRLVGRDLVLLGYEAKPGSQFIVDYVFDLKHEESKEAFNQILRSTLKFKDVAVMTKFGGASKLKDKLISSFEKAEKVFEQDRHLPPSERRISRIFKGFNDYDSTVSKLKLSAIVASIKKDSIYTDGKITFFDKNEKNLQFYYPSRTKFMEAKLGKGFLELKDQSSQVNFGLIPRFNSENATNKNPEFGVTFERRDKYFSDAEQQMVYKYMLGQIPKQHVPLVDLSEWTDREDKRDSKIFFQMIIKAQAFNHLKGFSLEEIQSRLIAYVAAAEGETTELRNESRWQKLKNFLFIGRNIRNERLKELGSQIYTILKNDEQNTEVMIRKLVELSDHGVFDKIGVGFLASLLPEEKLNELVYVKLEFLAQKVKPLAYEFGKLSYKELYNELTIVQSNISGRSYDLRINDGDLLLEKSDMDIEKRMIDLGLETNTASN